MSVEKWWRMLTYVLSRMEHHERELYVLFGILDVLTNHNQPIFLFIVL